MSRIGRLPIPLPPGVKVEITGQHIVVQGPKGTLERDIHPRIRVEQQDGQLVVKRRSDDREDKALHGLTRALVANMVTGVTQGFSKGIEISGVGLRANKVGEKLVMQLGFSHPVEMVPPPGITFQLEGPQRVLVQGIDKELVGQVAATIRAIRPISPYGNPPKGLFYVGERVRRKAGKAAGKGGKK